MYKVFLVDSDAQARTAIREEFPWSPADFMLIGEAVDGESALMKIRDLHPDILMVATEMPFMDGFTLCREARRRFPWMEIILISARDDLAINASDRMPEETEILLRPLSVPVLEAALKRTVTRMRKKIRELPEVICRNCLDVSPETKALEREIMRWLESDCDAPACWTLPGRVCRLATITPTSDEAEWCACGVLRILEREYSDENRVKVFQLAHEFGMIVAGETEEEAEEYAYRLATTLKQAVEYSTSARLIIRISDSVYGTGELRDTYRVLHRGFPVRSSLRQISGVGDPMRANAGMRPDLSVLSEYLLCADSNQLERIFRHIHKNVFASPRMIAQAVRILDEETGCVSPDEDEWRPRLSREEQYGQLQRALERRDRHRPDCCAFPLNRIRSRIAEKFDDPGLSVYDVAGMAGVAPSRLCAVFEQEMGITVTEYIAHLRINRARELLIGSRMRIAAIAEYVGFFEEGYFCWIFERITSYSPREYRRMHAIMPQPEPPAP